MNEIITLKPMAVLSPATDDCHLKGKRMPTFESMEFSDDEIVQEIIFTETGEIVVLGMPIREENATAENYHNCDQMGCGYAHVLRRKRI